MRLHVSLILLSLASAAYANNVEKKAKSKSACRGKILSFVTPDELIEALRKDPEASEELRRQLLSDPAKLDLAVAGMIYGKKIPPELKEPLKTFLRIPNLGWSPELEKLRASILAKVDKKQMLTDQEAQAISKISPDLLVDDERHAGHPAEGNRHQAPGLLQRIRGTPEPERVADL